MPKFGKCTQNNAILWLASNTPHQLVRHTRVASPVNFTHPSTKVDNTWGARRRRRRGDLAGVD
uniref:Uncharacterized protein n=1 Tax=Oryza barthii TaxID=65489 RepID=A0A0D3H6K1_9ORYZ